MARKRKQRPKALNSNIEYDDNQGTRSRIVSLDEQMRLEEMSLQTMMDRKSRLDQELEAARYVE